MLYPINYPKGIQEKQEYLSIMMGNIHGKVMVRTLGLLRVKGGSHWAWHLWGKFNQKQSSNVSVYHFPIRSKEHFYANVENRHKLLDKGVTKMGSHYKRWAKMLDDDCLDKELKRLVLDENYARVLTDLGVICHDETPRKKIKPQLEAVW